MRLYDTEKIFLYVLCIFFIANVDASTVDRSDRLVTLTTCAIVGTVAILIPTERRKVSRLRSAK